MESSYTLMLSMGVKRMLLYIWLPLRLLVCFIITVRSGILKANLSRILLGVITATATNPIWVVKTVMQLQQQDRPHVSSSSSTASTTARPPLPLPQPPSTKITSIPPVFTQSFRSLSSPPAPLSTPVGRPTSYSTAISIFQKQGIKGFYRGLSASLLGVTEGTIQWSLYEQFKIVAKSGREDEEGGWRVSAAAGSAKLVATMITYPHEVNFFFHLRYSQIIILTTRCDRSFELDYDNLLHLDNHYDTQL